MVGLYFQINNCCCAPLLCNLFGNDVGRCLLDCKFVLFTDDLQLYRVIHEHVDCEALQIICIRDLGVTIHSQLICRDHCAHIAGRALQILWKVKAS